MAAERTHHDHIDTTRAFAPPDSPDAVRVGPDPARPERYRWLLRDYGIPTWALVGYIKGPPETKSQPQSLSQAIKSAAPAYPLPIGVRWAAWGHYERHLRAFDAWHPINSEHDDE